jgi:hypothetical protein
MGDVRDLCDVNDNDVHDVASDERDGNDVADAA